MSRGFFGRDYLFRLNDHVEFVFKLTKNFRFGELWSIMLIFVFSDGRGL